MAKTAMTILALVAFAGIPLKGVAQTAPKTITASRVARAEGEMTGPVYVTIGGEEKKIAAAGVDSWLIEGGRRVVYSGRDGAGGFENEGMSLHAYDAQAGRTRKIMAEYFSVDKLTEVNTSTGKTVLLVDLGDGGLGASYVAVVDPVRGEVFFRHWARIISRQGDMIVIGRYKEADWDKLAENEGAKVTPYRKERYNLNSLLKRRVIVNKPDR